MGYKNAIKITTRMHESFNMMLPTINIKFNINQIKVICRGKTKISLSYHFFSL